MTQDRSREAFLAFHDYLGKKGLVPTGTAQARKASANKVLAILEPDEAEDVTQIDLDDVMKRFANLHGSDYSPGSLKTYKSRVGASLDDFRSYVSNPMAFRPNIKTRQTTKKASTDSIGASDRSTSAEEPRRAQTSSAPSSIGGPEILPIPLRPDLTVRIQGLPYDLSAQEAKKIANVIQAMAMAKDN